MCRSRCVCTHAHCQRERPSGRSETDAADAHSRRPSQVFEGDSQANAAGVYRRAHIVSQHSSAALPVEGDTTIAPITMPRMLASAAPAVPEFTIRRVPRPGGAGALAAASLGRCRPSRAHPPSQSCRRADEGGAGGCARAEPPGGQQPGGPAGGRVPVRLATTQRASSAQRRKLPVPAPRGEAGGGQVEGLGFETQRGGGEGAELGYQQRGAGGHPEGERKSVGRWGF